MVTIPPLGRLYVWCVFACGIAAIGHSLYGRAAEPIGYQWLFLAGLTLVSGSFTVRLPSRVSET